MSFKAGDVVQLNSGGPLMTVTGALPDAQSNPPCYRCTWIHDGKQELGTFPEVALRLEPLPEATPTKARRQS